MNGFKDLPTGRALFLEFGGAGGPPFTQGAWLRALDAVAPVTSAVPPGKDDPGAQVQATAVAFTWTGLEKMKLSETALASFSRPFREGMFQEDRLRRLGDRRASKTHPDGEWLDTVVEGGPIWSGNTPRRPSPPHTVGAYDVLPPAEERPSFTPRTVHAILLLYTRDTEAALALSARLRAVLAPEGVGVVHELDLVLDVEAGSSFSREHFGFADGLSQPVPFDESGAVVLNGQAVRERDPVQGAPLGEFLIGYLNGHHEPAPGPVVRGEDKRPIQAGLLPYPDAQGFFDFGLNGSYLVVRELKQDVAAFWRSMDRNAETIRTRDPENSGHVTAEWLAERVVGRDRDGHLLCPMGKLRADAQGQPNSDYLFHDDDPHGLGCPPGSHVRRANPRDSLLPLGLTAKAVPAARETALRATNNHRILRRGRKFGPKIADYRTPDDQDRGLLFMCLNTDIARQFEFVQQTWLLNSDFATLFDEVDPLIGPDGRMTIREQPLRRTVHVETYVQMAGGDYFFLPSLPALRYLALL